MWNVPPARLCNQHLLGEHVEMHMFAGSLRRGISLAGYVEKGLVELDQIESRHDELAQEMQQRGMAHRSPLAVPAQPRAGKVDAKASLDELVRRCGGCRKRIP